MLGLTVSITRFVDEAQPGWVECQFTDVHGKEWRVVDKVPVVTTAPLTASSSYPQAGMLACQVIVTWLDITGREVVSIDISTPWGLKASTGETTFDVLASQLKTL